MGNGLHWSIEDLKKRNMAANEQGVYVPIDQLTTPAYKVKKVGNILERALQQSEPDNAVVNGNNGTKIFIKPLSVNAAYKGRRFKTKEHDKYCDAVSLLLPNDITVPDGFLKVEYEFGLSSNGGDFDNPVKPIQDILSKKYGFNDNKIMIATIRKVIVPKGKEYIKFTIDKL